MTALCLEYAFASEFLEEDTNLSKRKSLEVSVIPLSWSQHSSKYQMQGEKWKFLIIPFQPLQ